MSLNFFAFLVVKLDEANAVWSVHNQIAPVSGFCWVAANKRYAVFLARTTALRMHFSAALLKSGADIITKLMRIWNQASISNELFLLCGGNTAICASKFE